LDSIPWVFTFTEGLDPTSDSWSVQCEIFEATLIGGLPHDEDIRPRPGDDHDHFQLDHFAFFGYGQPGNGPPVPPPPFPPFNPFAAPNPSPQN
jgi:hypothetical protein